MRELKMMFRLLRASAKSQVLYRADFVVGLIGTLAYNATFLASIGVITGSFGSIGGFSALEIVLLYGLFEIAHGLYGFFLKNMSSHLERLVTDGKLDVMLLRPYSVLTQMNGSKMDFTAFVDVFIGVACFTFAAVGMNADWGLRWLMLPVFLISGMFIEFALSLLMNCATVVYPNTRSLYGAYYQFVLIGQRYPLRIFSAGFRAILTFLLPLGFMNYYPMLYLTGRPEGWIGLFAPLAALVFSLLAVAAFNGTLRRYNSTGN